MNKEIFCFNWVSTVNHSLLTGQDTTIEIEVWGVGRVHWLVEYSATSMVTLALDYDKPPEMSEMTKPSKHRIRNLKPGGLRHATSLSRRLPTISSFTSGCGRNTSFFFFKPPRPGNEPNQTPGWKAVMLTTTQGHLPLTRRNWRDETELLYMLAVFATSAQL